MLTDTGSIFYQDEIGQIYTVEWTKINDQYDITTVTKMPYVWGMDPEGYIRGSTVFRKGIITVIRQVIKLLSDGYSIIAEGTSQYVDYFQVNFVCGDQPRDIFKYHLNNFVNDEVEIVVPSGARWADPDSSVDVNALWADILSDGTLATGTTADIDDFAWIDVWSN